MILQDMTFAKLSIYLVTIAVMLLLGVFILQNAFGLVPCELCLWQRYPYFAVLFGAVLVPLYKEYFAVQMQMLAFLVNIMLSFYHSGIERGLWQGFTACSTQNIAGLSVEELRDFIHNAPMVKCTDINWSLFGLSLTNYNFIISVGLLVFSGYYFIKLRRVYGKG